MELFERDLMGNARLKTLVVIRMALLKHDGRCLGKCIFVVLHWRVLRLFASQLSHLKLWQSLDSTAPHYRRWRSTTATLIRKGGIPSFQISYTTQPASMHRMPQTTNFRRLSLTLTRYLTLWSVSWIQTKSTTECPWLVGRYFAITSVVVLLSAINTRLLWHGLERHALCSFVGGKRFGWKY